MKIPPAAWARGMLVVAALGVLLMIGGSLLNQADGGDGDLTRVTAIADSSAAQNGKEKPGQSDLTQEESILESRVKTVLEKIAGVGRVEVSITLASSPQQEYAVNEKQDQREINEKDEKGGTRVTTEKNQDHQTVLLPASSQSSSSPLVVREVAPEIKGVLVVCEGASDARVREEITMALQTSLSIPSYRIKVMPRTIEGR